MPTTVGLFSGIGGLELGFERKGFRTLLTAEMDGSCSRVLTKNFPGAHIVGDVADLGRLPKADALVAGFPCQPYSPAGRTLGLYHGRNLLNEMLRLLKRGPRPSIIVLENVPFITSLHDGAAVRLITDRLSEYGYSWAYRTIDTLSHGLPQRRRRWFLVASLEGDAARILFGMRQEALPDRTGSTAHGFYWTEGNRGIGWADDAIPPLKGGSAFGIASPPAIWHRETGEIFTPDIRDAERLQGFKPNWTRMDVDVDPREERLRWRMIGNAVSVPVAEWLASAVRCPGSVAAPKGRSFYRSGPWPASATGFRGRRYAVNSVAPFRSNHEPITDFLSYRGSLLSYRATHGFRERYEASGLRRRPGFVKALKQHERLMKELERE